ncbi:hypothetical protein [Methylobacterium radiotolerans]|uniref:Chitinase n=1 Tax=Methylobacterium radiotolerans (strain ATCC 27329 / DSM 1819 / JCM 2831 / NBRC 15690 / NCIMB 10815 / 0-1) TaxID=426355 RepID=B1M1N5_METRJ|nr:hypothetical protein [Methylobacterium radiotolerans]ACB27618.1 hypothetical protein Mrad2831_5673 [Methylobacterium radiotolerans JCM 2831]GEM95939.1 hypothetical protein MRA01_04790 [Methylobacterium radiotolerans]
MAASLNRSAFFDRVRAAPFGGRLSASQVAGLTAILDACPALLGLTSLAYCLATTFHETARTMQPIEEYGRGKGRTYGPTGFWGRGFVQLTWEANYAKATAALRKLGVLTAAEDLVKTPALAMRPDVAAVILFYGMVEGWFTGKKLADYFGPGRNDAVGARRIINGTDKAATIAGYHATFVDALTAGGYAAIPAAAAPAPAAPSSPPKLPSQPAPAAPAEPGFWSRLHTLLSRKDKVA